MRVFNNYETLSIIQLSHMYYNLVIAKLQDILKLTPFYQSVKNFTQRAF